MVKTPMIDHIFVAVVGLVAAILAVAATRRLLLSYAALYLYRPAPRSDYSPVIWIVCACRNEARRLPRLIAGLAGLSYRGKWRFVLIDDWSDDGSPALITAAKEQDPEHVHAVLLAGRQHGKADALRAGLNKIPVAEDDLILVIDADHQLKPESLDNLANYFVSPEVAAVAIEHPVSQPARSIVSAYCYLEAAVSEVVTSRGQHGLGVPTKLAGSWACRADVFHRLFPHGWQLIDDTVFTASIVAEGGQIAYAADVAALQDVPDTIKGYLSQHLRWSAGYAESAAKAISARTGHRSVLQHIDAAATHAGYFERPLLIMLVLLAGSGWALGTTLPLLIAGAVILIYVLVMIVQITVALRLSGASARLVVMSIASLPMLAVDMMISIRGTFTGLMRRRVSWTTDHR